MEHVFQEERKNLHDFLDDLPVGLYTCTRDFQIEYANHAFARIVGVAREDLIGTDFRKYLGENVETPQNTTWSGRLFFVSTAHETVECFVAQESFRGNREYKIRGVAVAGIPSDRDVKKELSASLDKISWLFNYAPVGIVFINRDGQITDCNAKVRSFLGAAKENILLKSIFDYVKTEDAAELKNSLPPFTLPPMPRLRWTSTSVSAAKNASFSSTSVRCAVSILSTSAKSTVWFCI